MSSDTVSFHAKHRAAESQRAAARVSVVVERAPLVLQELKMLRLRGQAPAGWVMVTTDRSWSEFFAEMNLAVIEVWRNDELDWSPIAGLDVLGVVELRERADRMQLYDAIRVGSPARLGWIAFWDRQIVGRIYDHGNGRIRGTV